MLVTDISKVHIIDELLASTTFLSRGARVKKFVSSLIENKGHALRHIDKIEKTSDRENALYDLLNEWMERTGEEKRTFETIFKYLEEIDEKRAIEDIKRKVNFTEGSNMPSNETSNEQVGTEITKKILRHCYQDLIKSFTTPNTTELSLYLFSKEVLQEAEYEEVRSERTAPPQTYAEKLLSIMLKKDGQQINIFLEKIKHMNLSQELTDNITSAYNKVHRS